ncbi:MAG: hypothetical protein IJ829_03500 [Kiritimatiellae bacterium]|nr:hypothetical protein [Kiritimatiellia bacterium]
MKRRGSALLVVLGVLAFLVVSAVAFSAFMRRARLPSSYLRRTVASRQLAKAAVVRAIDEIDAAIADGVHPGIGGTRENTWQDRVFYKGGGDQSLGVTAPTLTLEGLAYIPPPLVNEARYRSRKTPTAVWQSFGYDVGRYAYCAIDVSDYFDVNRLVADYPRSSAANRRVTIAHLFEDVNHRSAPSGADAWDDFMDAFRKIDDETLELDFEAGSKIPLVSMADFNLALADKGSVGLMKSPFGEYVSRASGSFYPAGSQRELETYAAMTFVTDGWFPKKKRSQGGVSAGGLASQAPEAELYDLADGKNQPFDMASLQKDKMKLSLAVLGSGMNTQSGETRDIWLNRLSGLGCAALADYLDGDRTPISLAVPTTERVPMICGVSPQLGAANFKVTVEGAEGEPTEKSKLNETQRTVEQAVVWKIDAAEIRKAFMAGRVQALAVYPFLHKDADDPTFKVDGQFSLFFSTPDLKMRTSANDVLHLAQNQIQESAMDSANGVIRVKLPNGNPTMKTLSTGAADTEEDAVWDSSTALSLQSGSAIAADLNNAGHEFLKVVYTWTQTRKDENDAWSPTTQQLLQKDVSNDDTVQVKASCGLPALDKDGKVDEDFTTRLEKNVRNPGWSKEIRLNAAVWLRVVNAADGKTVDLVPACISDDRVQNNVNDPDTRVQIIGQDEFAGKPYPLMRFDTGVKLHYGVQSLLKLAADNGGGTPIEISPKAVMVGDPRFNYAPEHWFAWDNDNLTAAEWLDNNYTGGDDRDGDIFLATSDQGYLQSKYELAFLPRFTNLRTFGNTLSSGNLQPIANAGNLDTFFARGKELNRALMWTSYDPVDLDEGAFEDLPFTSEGTGMKVNPYSDSTNVLMAAFANTPIDWRRASTNLMDGASEDYAAMGAAEFNKKYAWNGYSSGGKFDWEDLERIAGRFMDRTRASGNSGWKSVWNKLGWYDAGKDGDQFLGERMQGDTDDFWDADRKFFYGFWRDCFDAKQQLFLIFVRAEPLLLGGSSADQLPPQLGARAVALVWRDPSTATTGTTGGYPHRTRLLFYKPLD